MFRTIASILTLAWQAKEALTYITEPLKPGRDDQPAVPQVHIDNYINDERYDLEEIGRQCAQAVEELRRIHNLLRQSLPVAAPDRNETPPVELRRHTCPNGCTCDSWTPGGMHDFHCQYFNIPAHPAM